MAEAANLGLRGEKGNAGDRFLGSWTLVSFEHVPPSGEVMKPFGDAPTGLILYQFDGHMSAQLSTGNRKKLSCGDPFDASPDEAAEAWGTYFGYWGSFSVDAERGVVVHRVEGSSFSNWVGTEQVRQFRFDGTNRLILETHSPSGHSTVIWQRMSD
ncbi:MAG: lipocalin-like domain-containing protein [Acidobacteriaceae bacterium]|nr:lipocalin-like domain-containing protein [Acidobacteriaceae bacterium]